MATKTSKAKEHIYAVKCAKKDKITAMLADYNSMYGEDGNEQSNNNGKIVVYRQIRK